MSPRLTIASESHNEEENTMKKNTYCKFLQMKTACNQTNLYLSLATACILLLLSGCSTVGPSSIRSGRLAYNEAIHETDNQQMLLFVIQNRYEERGSLMAVASITANVHITSKAGIQAGFGDTENYSGNLVPISAGVVYEENPTILYTPVTGAKYARQLFSPIPISVLAQMTGTLTDPASVYNALVSSVNGIRNPEFQDPDPRFSRFVTIMTRLTEANCLHWIENQRQSGSYSIIIDHYAPTYTAEVGELLTLSGLPAPTDSSAQVILPVFLAMDGHESDSLGITTRSVADLMKILSAAIDVPEEDLRKGVAATYPEPGLAGRGLRIHHSRTKPEHTTVAVQYRDGWFYIDETDQATKRFFRLMGVLWSVTIAESTPKGHAAPVLTIPVSR